MTTPSQLIARRLGRSLIIVVVLLLFLAPLVVPLAINAVRSNVDSPRFQLNPNPVLVRRGDIASSFRSRGQVAPSRSLVVQASLTGTVDSLSVEEGTLIELGTSIVRLIELGSIRKHHTVNAPFGGRVVSFMVEKGATVQAGQPLFEIESSEAVVEAQIHPSNLYEFSDRPEGITATIIDGPGPFDCGFLGIRRATSPAQASAETRVTQYILRCQIPADVRAIIGAPAELQIISKSANDVLLVPRTAVFGRGQERFVTLVSGPRRWPVRVTVGIFSEIEVEIVSGVKEGDTVLDIAPIADAT